MQFPPPSFSVNSPFQLISSSCFPMMSIPAFSIICPSWSGLMNFSYSCVPLGTMLRMYSAARMWVSQVETFLDMVDRRMSPPGLAASTTSATNWMGFSTCYMTSIEVTMSNEPFLSLFFPKKSPRAKFQQQRFFCQGYASSPPNFSEWTFASSKDFWLGSKPTTFPPSLAKLLVKNPAPQPTSKMLKFWKGCKRWVGWDSASGVFC